MPLTRRRITDAPSLKALAHPLRLAILEVLVTEGARTATQLGKTLDESPANCSWHLRKLAEHGFVREAPGTGGRARPWRVVSEGLSWGDTDDDPTVQAAGQGLADLLLEREVQRLRAARAVQDREPPQWREAISLNESKLWLTAPEAQELSEAILELFSRHFERAQDPSRRPEGARLMSAVGWLVPNGPYRVDRDPPETTQTREPGQ